MLCRVRFVCSKQRGCICVCNRSGRTPVHNMSYNPAENSVLVVMVCIVHELDLWHGLIIVVRRDEAADSNGDGCVTVFAAA